jgi:hypothetical protein
MKKAHLKIKNISIQFTPNIYLQTQQSTSPTSPQ